MTRSFLLVIYSSLFFCLAACSSQKNTAESQSALMNAQVSVDSNINSSINSRSFDFLAAICASLNISFTSDSIVSGDTVIYGAAVNVDATEPEILAAEEEVCCSAESASHHIDAQLDVATNSENSTVSESAAIGKPPDLTLIFVASTILIFFFLIIGFWFYKWYKIR